MAFDLELAERLRVALDGVDDVVEKRMFGGLAFMVGGHMAVGITKDDQLMVRVGPQQHAESLALPHARPMDFTGRPMKGMVFVDPPGYAAETDLQTWVERALSFVTELPPK